MKQQLIIKKIFEGYDAERLCNEFRLDLSELFSIVEEAKENNVYLYPKIASNAKLVFTNKKENLDNDVNIKVKNDNISFLAISDIHDGSKHDYLPRLDSINNYLINNNINILLNMGDNIDGPVHKDQSTERRIANLESQIHEFVNIYPYIYGANIMVLGDHDLKYKTDDGYNLNKALKSVRKDIKVYSSGYGIIKFNGTDVLICHDVFDPRIKQKIDDSTIVLSGHSHRFIDRSNSNSIRIVTPSLSNLPMINNNAPGFLKFDLNFGNELLSGIVVNIYTFIDDKIYLVGTKEYKFKQNDVSCSRVYSNNKRKYRGK